MKKIFVVIVTLLMFLTTIVIIPNNLNVNANPEENGESDKGGIGEYNGYLYNTTKDISYTIFSYSHGREFGTDGERHTAENIKNEMDRIGLSNPHTELLNGSLIKSIWEEQGKNGAKNLEYIDDTFMVHAYDLVIKEDGHPDDYPECYAIPTTIPFPDPYLPRINANFSFSNLKVHHSQCYNASFFENYSFNVDYSEASMAGSTLIGEVINATEGATIPDNLDDLILLLDENDPEYQDKINESESNNASGFILISSGRFGTKINTTIAGVTVLQSDGIKIKNKIENGSTLAYNILDQYNFTNNLTIAYHFNETLTEKFGPIIDGFLMYIRSPTPDQFFHDLIWSAFRDYGYVGWYGRLNLDLHIAKLLSRKLPCRGAIFDNYKDDIYTMISPMRFWNVDNPFQIKVLSNQCLPTLSVNRDVGDRINEDAWRILKRLRIDYYIDQSYEEDIASYNVIGNSTRFKNPNRVAIIGGHYDAFSGQCSGDNAIGPAILLTLAKYIEDYHLIPKYKLRFLAFAGEDYGDRGSNFHNLSHPDDDIEYMLNLDMLGYYQDEPPVTFVWSANIEQNSNIIKNLTQQTSYVERTGYSAERYQGPSPSDNRTPSDNMPFENRPGTKTISFGKDRNFTNYHSTGTNYDEGDSMKNMDRNDMNVTLELAWNVSKYYFFDPDCWFSNVTFGAFDSPNDGDTLNDSIRANFTLHTILPQDLNQVQLDLGYEYEESSGFLTDVDRVDYLVTSDGVQESYVFTIPDNVAVMNYSIGFKLYNSTGRINKIVYGSESSNYNDTSGSSQWYTLHHPLGYTKKGDLSQSVHDRISGSIFTANEDAIADNITALINQNFMSPGPYQCMIYRANDSTLIGTTTDDWYSLPQGEPVSSAWWAVFDFTGTKPLLEKGVQYVLSCWGANAYSLVGYDESGLEETGAYDEHAYGTPPNPASFTAEPRYYSIYCSYTTDVLPPNISNVSQTPETVGFGGNVTIQANVTDTLSGVNTVNVSITYPDETSGNYTMTHHNGDMYTYVFNTTWLVGQYDYTIWALDNLTNMNSSTGHHFNVSANATITVQTLQNTYYQGEYVNLTDPPGDGEENTVDYFGDINVPETYHLIINEDANMITVDTRDGLVWKFNKGTTGYNEIWHNGTRLIDEEQWILQNLQHGEWLPSGTPQQIIVEQPEPYHAIVKRIYSNHIGTDFTISYEFYGQSRTKIKFEGTIGEINNYRLIWNASGINADFAESNTNDHYTRILITGEQGFVFDYSDVYRTLGDITCVETQNTQDGYTLEQTFNLGILSPGHYVLDPTFGYTTQGGSGLSIGNSIRGSWFTCPSDGVATNIKAYITHSGLSGGSTNGKCAIYTYQADNDATDLIGETNQISLSGSGWKTFTFTNGPRLTAGTKYFLVAWASTSTLITDTLVYTTETAKGIAKTSTTYGTWPNPLTGETPVNHKYSIYCTYNASPIISNPFPANDSRNISRYPTMHVKINDSEGENMNITFSSNATGSWQSFGEIKLGTGNTFGYPWSSSTSESIEDVIRGTWFTCPANGTALKIYVYAHPIGGAMNDPYHMKAALYYKSNNTKLVETQQRSFEGLWDPDPYPAWIEFTFTSPPTLHAGVEYYALVWGDNSHGLYYTALPDSNKSISINQTYGTWPTTLNNVNYSTGKIYDIYVQYSTASTPNGTYYMDNFDMNNAFTRYFWNVSTTDGASTTNSNVYHFRTAGNQSKINNTGTTNISGYLLMKVQYYSTTYHKWFTANLTVNETTPRTILAGQRLALDTIFNGKVSTSDLFDEYGNVAYRVYAAFRDPDGNILVCDDATDLVAIWEFAITSS